MNFYSNSILSVRLRSILGACFATIVILTLNGSLFA